MGELITVIINVYNREKFISKCLESIINQTYKNLEILIVNDGSTDDTLRICKNYKDGRIRIITTDNFGLSISRNIGIKNSKGKYLYFVDSDDFIEEDTIEYLYNLCKKYNTKLSTCKPVKIYDYNITKKSEPEEIAVIDSYEMLKKVLVVKDSAGTTWNKLYKKELFNNIRFENRIINDIVVTYKTIIAAEKIAYSNQKKYYYLKHKNAITIDKYENYDRAVDLYKASLERYRNIEKIYANFIENDVGMIRNIIKLYMIKNPKVEDFLKEENAIQLFKEMFSVKIFISNISYRLKIIIMLFSVSPKLTKKIVNRFRRKKFKM